MKRILSLLLALVIAISAAVPAYATGDGNFDGGGGSMGDGTKTNYWNPGMDGVRVSIVDVGSHSVVRTPIDLTNKVPIANVAHFGKVSKLSYNAGRGLSVSVSGYSYRNPSQSLPKIISTSSSKASIAAIRSYFTDEQVIRSIAGYAGMDFDTLIGGDYKLVVEPLAYLCYNGQQFAMTATEAALYDQVVNGDLRKKLGTLTHKNLPLAIFLEEADLGYAAWSGSRTEKASNGDIISSLGIGIVRFNEVTTPPDPGEYDYEYRVNTEVITSVEVRGGQSDPDNPVSVRFSIQGRTYTVSNVYYPDGDSQLAWVRWRTPAEPCVITISVSVYGGGSAQGTITCNIVDLDGNDPPNPLADDRNNGFRPASVPEKEQVTSASWGIWSPWWQENWEWVENWQKCWHTDRWTDADGKTHRDRWYHWVDNGWWEDHGWWEFDYNGYSASLTASMRITPDEKSPTATASTLKSGYGVQEKVTAKVTTNQSAAVTAAQNAVTYFPEFVYESYWRLLEAEISRAKHDLPIQSQPLQHLQPPHPLHTYLVPGRQLYALHMASGLLDAGRNALHEPDGPRHHPGESLGGVAYCSRKTTIETEELMRKKRILILTALVLLLCCAFSTTAFAAGTGDVASAVESTWKTASGQIKTVVNNVVFPAIDLILAVFFFAKLGTAYFDYRKSGQFEWTAPAILFACLVFTLTAPLYIWQIIGI